MILVTKPFLPPIEDYQHLLIGIWERNWLTNNGPLVNQLELELKRKLAINNLLYLNNGTIAIQLALKALHITGQVITTPFSYIATTSSIVWEGCDPVFVDIDEYSFNINPAYIEAAITPHTQAILATHCFGNPCDIDAIDAIAKRNGLRVIYDAAHCFGTRYRNTSVFAFGDVATTSFHATKLFHTVEGGAVFTPDEEILKRLSYMRNFGHDGPEKFNGVGINGKNSEFHAAMGLANLKHIDSILERRKEQFLRYNYYLRNVPAYQQHIHPEADYNYAYYPLVFESQELAMRIKKLLEDNKIFTRRYFYPSLSSLAYVKHQSTPISDSVASRILCFPLYHDLTEADQLRIVEILNSI